MKPIEVWAIVYIILMLVCWSYDGWRWTKCLWAHRDIYYCAKRA